MGNEAELFSRVEGSEFGIDELTVFADEFVIEVDFAAATSFGLDADEIPVDLGAVAIVSHRVSLARSEVERAGNLLIEEDVAHRLGDQRVHAESEFAEVASAFIGVEDLVDFAVLARSRGFNDATVFDAESDGFKRNALVNRRRVVLDGTVDTVANRGRVDFAVREVTLADARHGRDALDGEAEVRARAKDADAVRCFHEFGQLFELRRDGLVVEEAGLEVEIFKVVRGHACLLSHARGRPAEDAPASVADALLHDRVEVAHGDGHGFRRDGRHFKGIEFATEGDIGIHVFHFRHKVLSGEFVLEVSGAGEEFAVEARLADSEEGDTTGFADGADECNTSFIRDLAEFQKDSGALFNFNRIIDDLISEGFVTSVSHAHALGTS